MLQIWETVRVCPLSWNVLWGWKGLNWPRGPLPLRKMSVRASEWELEAALAVMRVTHPFMLPTFIPMDVLGNPSNSRYVINILALNRISVLRSRSGSRTILDFEFAKFYFSDVFVELRLYFKAMYDVRNLEKTIRFSLKSRPSEWFHWPEMS